MKIPVLWPDEVGLESVEDKSAGYHYRSYRSSGRGRDDRKGSVRSRGGKNTRKTQRISKSRKPQKSEDSVIEKSNTDFSKLSEMSLDERMAYYKKQYAPSAAPKSEKKRPQPKKAQKPAVQKAPKDSMRKAPEPKVEEVKTEVKSARKGLFSRIKARIFGA